MSNPIGYLLGFGILLILECGPGFMINTICMCHLDIEPTGNFDETHPHLELTWNYDGTYPRLELTWNYDETYPTVVSVETPHALWIRDVYKD